MRNLKHGLMAAAAVTFGFVSAAPAVQAAPDEIGPQVSQSVGPRQTANAATADAMRTSQPRSRAELDAWEREVTKRLNEQQLQRMHEQQLLRPSEQPYQ